MAIVRIAISLNEEELEQFNQLVQLLGDAHGIWTKAGAIRYMVKNHDKLFASPQPSVAPTESSAPARGPGRPALSDEDYVLKAEERAKRRKEIKEKARLEKQMAFAKELEAEVYEKDGYTYAAYYTYQLWANRQVQAFQYVAPLDHLKQWDVDHQYRPSKEKVLEAIANLEKKGEGVIKNGSRA